MEQNEARLWLITVVRALKGDQEAKEMLRVENQLRAEKGQPTVEEELKAMAANQP